MKKIIALLLVAIMCLSLAACGGENNSKENMIAHARKINFNIVDNDCNQNIVAAQENYNGKMYTNTNAMFIEKITTENVVVSSLEDYENRLRVYLELPAEEVTTLDLNQYIEFVGEIQIQEENGHSRIHVKNAHVASDTISLECVVDYETDDFLGLECDSFSPSIIEIAKEENNITYIEKDVLWKFNETEFDRANSIMVTGKIRSINENSYSYDWSTDELVMYDIISIKKTSTENKTNGTTEKNTDTENMTLLEKIKHSTSFEELEHYKSELVVEDEQVGYKLKECEESTAAIEKAKELLRVNLNGHYYSKRHNSEKKSTMDDEIYAYFVSENEIYVMPYSSDYESENIRKNKENVKYCYHIKEANYFAFHGLGLKLELNESSSISQKYLLITWNVENNALHIEKFTDDNYSGYDDRFYFKNKENVKDSYEILGWQ